MMENRSKINPRLTVEFLLTAPEDKMFDRKSAQIKASDIAPLISAFANASGGTIVIGINEKTKGIEELRVCDQAFYVGKIHGYFKYR